MLIPHGFDIANNERRKLITDNNYKTAKKLAGRISHFVKQVNENHSIKPTDKNCIKELLRYAIDKI